MAMNRVEMQELLNVLESIRAEKYPDISADLIAQIAQAQFEHQDNRAEGRHQTNRCVDEFLLSSVSSNIEEGAGNA